MPATRRAVYKRFLRRLQLAREDAGLSQREAAQRMNRSQAWIAKSETGDRRVDVGELHDFARVYGKPVSYFTD